MVCNDTNIQILHICVVWSLIYRFIQQTRKWKPFSLMCGLLLFSESCIQTHISFLFYLLDTVKVHIRSFGVHCFVSLLYYNLLKAFYCLSKFESQTCFCVLSILTVKSCCKISYLKQKMRFYSSYQLIFISNSVSNRPLLALSGHYLMNMSKRYYHICLI